MLLLEEWPGKTSTSPHVGLMTAAVEVRSLRLRFRGRETSYRVAYDKPGTIHGSSCVSDLRRTLLRWRITREWKRRGNAVIAIVGQRSDKRPPGAGSRKEHEGSGRRSWFTLNDRGPSGRAHAVRTTTASYGLPRCPYHSRPHPQRRRQTIHSCRTTRYVSSSSFGNCSRPPTPGLNSPDINQLATSAGVANANANARLATCPGHGCMLLRRWEGAALTASSSAWPPANALKVRFWFRCQALTPTSAL